MKKATLVAFLALGLGGCAAGYVTSNSAPVNLLIAAITSAAGTPILQSSAVDASGTVTSDFATVALAVRAKNPNVTTVSVPEHVLIERYDIQYVRSDGHNAEGVDVPYHISGLLSSEVDVATSGTSTVVVEVVRAQAKLEPPLKNLTSPNGGAKVLTCFAQITIYGHTIAGEAVSATGQLQIDFAGTWQ
jgi:hypothetical protein